MKLRPIDENDFWSWAKEKSALYIDQMRARYERCLSQRIREINWQFMQINQMIDNSTNIEVTVNDPKFSKRFEKLAHLLMDHPGRVLLTYICAKNKDWEVAFSKAAQEVKKAKEAKR